MAPVRIPEFRAVADSTIWISVDSTLVSCNLDRLFQFGELTLCKDNWLCRSLLQVSQLRRFSVLFMTHIHLFTYIYIYTNIYMDLYIYCLMWTLLCWQTALSRHLSSICILVCLGHSSSRRQFIIILKHFKFHLQKFIAKRRRKQIGYLKLLKQPLPNKLLTCSTPTTEPVYELKHTVYPLRILFSLWVALFFYLISPISLLSTWSIVK